MGLGKTIQAIAALRCLFAAGEAQAVLVVAPAGLVLQWRRELRAWAPELRLLTVIGAASARAQTWRGAAQVYVTSYESLRSDIDSCGILDREWDAVIIDEAQRIKNPDTEVSRAVKRLERRRSWALTGTPLEIASTILVSILDFVAPGRFDPKTYVRGLEALLREVQLRRRRRDVLPQLPPKLSSEVLLGLEPQQRPAYLRAEREGLVRLTALGPDLKIVHVLELILRLKQICNFCPETGASIKLVDLRRRLKELIDGGERALVFSQFAAEPFGIKRLATELSEFAPLTLSGEMAPQARSDAVRDFEDNPDNKLLLLSLRAGGVGLNLTAASYVFHFDHWWNPAVEAQAEDRAHLIGQVRPVQVYSYLCANTVEERVASILAHKRKMFSDVVEGVSLHELHRLGLAELMAAVINT